MRTLYPLVAAACLLAAPLASAQCGARGTVNVTAQRSAPADAGGYIATGAQLADAVEGSYALSNGRRLDLVDLDQRVYADFDAGKWSRVALLEVGPHRFASREGDVQLTYVPGPVNDTIMLSYPADSRGRLKRGACS